MSYRIALSLRDAERPQWRWATQDGHALEFVSLDSATEYAATLRPESITELISGPPFAFPVVPRVLPDPPAPAPAKIPLIHETVVVGASQRDWNLDLVTSGDPPEFSWDDIQSGAARKFYDDQANRIIDALQKTLPGGTVDSIFAELARRKASLFRVISFASEVRETEELPA
jgi:hypothetical protein